MVKFNWPQVVCHFDQFGLVNVLSSLLHFDTLCTSEHIANFEYSNRSPMNLPCPFHEVSMSTQHYHIHTLYTYIIYIYTVKGRYVLGVRFCVCFSCDSISVFLLFLAIYEILEFQVIVTLWVFHYCLLRHSMPRQCCIILKECPTMLGMHHVVQSMEPIYIYIHTYIYIYYTLYIYIY